MIFFVGSVLSFREEWSSGIVIVGEFGSHTRRERGGGGGRVSNWSTIRPSSIIKGWVIGDIATSYNE